MCCACMYVCIYGNKANTKLRHLLWLMLFSYYKQCSAREMVRKVLVLEVWGPVQFTCSSYRAFLPSPKTLCAGQPSVTLGWWETLPTNTKPNQSKVGCSWSWPLASIHMHRLRHTQTHTHIHKTKSRAMFLRYVKLHYSVWTYVAS